MDNNSADIRFQHLLENDTDIACLKLHDLYLSLISSGFKADEAIQIIVAII